MLNKLLNRQNASLRHITIDNADIHYREIRVDEGKNLPLIIGLHGYGSNEKQIETLVGLDIDQPHIYLAPRAFESVDNRGYGWFPTQISGNQIEADTDTVRSALARVAHFSHAITNRYQADPRRIFIVGYSMGGSMSMMLSLLHPDSATAFVAMAGTYLPQITDFTAPTSQLQGKPIFVGHGTLDNLISQDTIQEAVQFLMDKGMDVTFRKYRIPHVVGTQERTDVSAWLNELMS